MYPRVYYYLINRRGVQLKLKFLRIPDFKKIGGGRVRSGYARLTQANQGKGCAKDSEHSSDR